MPKKIRVRWSNLPGRVGVTIEGGRRRELGPRGLLSLAETAAALDRSVHDVRAEIRARFLRAVHRAGRTYVTVQAARAFLAEERRDIERASRTLRGIRAGRIKAIPWEEACARMDAKEN